jgi:zinc transport system substrate-binding protein
LEIDPDGAERYRENADRLLEEIELLRIDLEERLVLLTGSKVFVFHPSYGYFCDEFNLRQRAIEFEGKSPKPKQLTTLINEVLAEKRLPNIFVQPEFNQAPAQAIAEATGAKVVVHSALDRNVLQSMKHFMELLLSQTQSE